VALSPFLRVGLPAIRAIRDALDAGDLTASLDAAQGLIGLGEGLTPSGDDFIGGMLFGMACLRAAERLSPRFPPESLRRFLTHVRQRTNRLSHTLMCDYAIGQGPEALHHLARALLAGEAVEDIRHLAFDVIRIGHSTGWDTLAGLWMTLNLVTANAVRPTGAVSRSRPGARRIGDHGSQTEDRTGQRRSSAA
jgi:hypothetical protein